VAGWGGWLGGEGVGWRRLVLTPLPNKVMTTVNRERLTIVVNNVMHLSPGFKVNLIMMSRLRNNIVAYWWPYTHTRHDPFLESDFFSFAVFGTKVTM
jgi:hypothetical protein